MSELKILPRFLPNKGLVLNKPEEILKNNFSVGDSRNMEFFNEYLQGRLGLLKFDSAQLSGPVLHKTRLRTYAGTIYEVFCTDNDIYKYDFTNTRYDILTPVYTAGSIQIGTWDSYTKFMCHADSTSGGTFIDEIGKTITNNSSCVLDLTTKKFGTGSVNLNGTDNFLSIVDSADFYFGTGPFTIDFQLNIDNYPSEGTTCGLIGQYADGDNYWHLILLNNAGVRSLAFQAATASAVQINTGFLPATLNPGTQNHIELGRNGNVFTIYVNGTSIGNVTDADEVPDIVGSLLIGCRYGPANFADVHFDEIRISKGIARHTADFIAPTSAYAGDQNLDKVVGSGTNWDPEATAGDYLKIGTGAPTTDDTWYQIQSITNDTGITLATSLPIGYAAGTGYMIRQCFQGTSTDFWHSREFQDTNLTETLILTNGVDTPVRWSGSGQVVPFMTTGTGPTGFVSAKYVEVYKDRVLFLHTIEVGNQPQRMRWSGVANCESWSDADFTDLITDGHWIKGSAVVADYHVVFREKDAYLGRFVGGDSVFGYEKSNSCRGLRGENSVVVKDRYAYYYGDDNKFHVFDLLSDSIISEGIFDRTKDYNPALQNYIYGYKVDRKNQIRWHCPSGDTSYNNETVVYDYMNNIIQIWEYQQAQGCCSIGEYEITSDLYLDDATWGEYYLDEQDGYFDDSLSLDQAPVLIYGGYDGYVRKADIGYTDDGTSYTRVFESIRDNFALPHMDKRLWKQEHWLQSQASGSISIKLKKDDGITFEATTASVSLIDTNRDIIKKQITWNKVAQNFKTRIEATNHFAMLGFSNYVFEKGKTVT